MVLYLEGVLSDVTVQWRLPQRMEGIIWKIRYEEKFEIYEVSNRFPEGSVMWLGYEVGYQYTLVCV